MKSGHRIVALVVAVAFVAPVAACGLSLAGLAPGDSADGGVPSADASLLDSAASGDTDATTGGGSVDGGGPGTPDAPSGDSSSPADAIADGGVDSNVPAPCTPFDSGLDGVLSLAAFTLVGSATDDENADGKITLTNSDTNAVGAAWYPTPLSGVGGYELTWSFRVGPGDTAGDGIVFAVLASGSAPGTGDDGDGIGLRNIKAPGGDGGVLAGYAVDVDMFKDTGDPTDLAATTLKLVTMPGFVAVAETAVPVAFNDGNVYAVDVSWRAPSTLTATLHTPDGGLARVTSADPGLSVASGFVGFTAATGGTSDSHNEIEGIVVTDTCR